MGGNAAKPRKLRRVARAARSGFTAFAAPAFAIPTGPGSDGAGN